VIKGFADRETERVWSGEMSRRLPQDIQQVARRKLRMLNNAAQLDDLRIPPANRLEALKGDRAGQHSIRINDRWRICFVWHNGDAVNVAIVDYH
jgi:toxin HigB-1